MMDELTPYHFFITFAQADGAFIQALGERDKMSQKISELERQIAQATERKIQAHAHVLQARKEHALKDLELKTITEHCRRASERLEKTTCSREYMSAQQELDRLLPKKEMLETAFIELWEALEKLELQYEQLVKKLLYEAEQNEIQRQEILEHRARCEHALSNFDATRLHARSRVPAEWITTYDMMRTRVSNPVVSVVGESCGGCVFNISAHEMQRIKKRQLVTCKQCFRILYSEGM